jgi:hypothetical protein
MELLFLATLSFALGRSFSPLDAYDSKSAINNTLIMTEVDHVTFPQDFSTVPVKIGSKTYNLIVDTGSNVS